MEEVLTTEEQRRLENRERLDRKERRFFRLGIALVVVLGLIGAGGIGVAYFAIQSQRESRAAASRRIDQLLTKIEHLETEIATLRTDAQANGKRIGELADQVAALQEQIRQLGGEPVVTTRPREASPSSSTTSTSTPRAPPSSTTSTTAPPTAQVCARLVGCVTLR